MFTGCPDGFPYQLAAKGCYHISSPLFPLTWDESLAKCRELAPGARLAIIQNKEQSDAIVNGLTNFVGRLYIFPK